MKYNSITKTRCQEQQSEKLKIIPRCMPEIAEAKANRQRKSILDNIIVEGDNKKLHGCANGFHST
jgi:hypothetical protein